MPTAHNAVLVQVPLLHAHVYVYIYVQYFSYIYMFYIVKTACLHTMHVYTHTLQSSPQVSLNLLCM